MLFHYWMVFHYWSSGPIGIFYLENIGKDSVARHSTFELSPQTDRHADTHDPHKPGKDQVSDEDAVPCAMFQEPVTTSSVVDEDHQQNRYPEK